MQTKGKGAERAAPNKKPEWVDSRATRTSRAEARALRARNNGGWTGAVGAGAGYSPGKLDEWLASIPAPDVEPTQDEIIAAEDVVMHADSELGPDEEPARIHPRFKRFYKPMLVALGAYASGVRVADMEARCGLTWTRLHVFAACDKKGWGILWRSADRIRRETLSQRVRDKAVQRVVEGDDVPVIGRVDRDTDGVVATRKTFSDRLTEYLIDEVKPVPERSTVQPGTGNTQIVGQQIVYNLPELPDWLAQNRPEPKKVVDVTPEKG